MKTTKYTINKPSIFHKTKVNKWVVLTKLKKQTTQSHNLQDANGGTLKILILYSILC